MVKRTFISLLITILVVALFIVINHHDSALYELKMQNQRVLARLDTALNQLASSRQQEEATQSTLFGTLLENEGLITANSDLSENLEITKDKLTLVQEDLDEIVKPFDADILSSALRSNVAHGEVLVTGGYQTSDGNYQYAFVEPKTTLLPDGSTAILHKTQHFSIAPEILSEFGLDTLITNAGNTLQHGEIWTSTELREIILLLKDNSGVSSITIPDLTAAPGRKEKIMVGDYQLTTRSQILEDGSGFDIEFRVEQARVPSLLAEEAN